MYISVCVVPLWGMNMIAYAHMPYNSWDDLLNNFILESFGEGFYAVFGSRICHEKKYNQI